MSGYPNYLQYNGIRIADMQRHHNTEEFHFGDVCSFIYGIYVTDIQIAKSPQRDVSFLSVPGRNGDLIVDNNRWHNIDITYSLAMASGFGDSFDFFKSDILSKNGYQKLHDSIYPDFFRMAIVKEPINPRTLCRNRAGTFDLTFHCKPQRYLKSGTYKMELDEPTELYNQHGFTAKPIITVYGNGPGTLTVGSVTVEIKDMEEQLILDSDLMDAYRKMGEGAPESMNRSIYAPEFPELAGGKNPISWTGGVSKIEIIPRWWTL